MGDQEQDQLVLVYLHLQEEQEIHLLSVHRKVIQEDQEVKVQVKVDLVVVLEEQELYLHLIPLHKQVVLVWRLRLQDLH
jgi:hypothetical protein